MALTAGAADASCRLALLLALDISSSVDADEDALQRSGLANALSSPSVVKALLAIEENHVALAVYEWSGRHQQTMVLDWVVLSDPAAIAGAAEKISSSERSFAQFPTALGYGIGYAATVFRTAPDCPLRTLDISGDGVNNDGFSPALAFRNFPLDGVTVNGLVIGGATSDDQMVFAYYRDKVIRGHGSFVETANDFDDFERAMRRKLLREVKVHVVGDIAPSHENSDG
ncbi:DUF1194 domain-containing protein [Actibacterium lipolyticum]|nr:DUF1194 domain-containing protein [Actibacterium lipolyticum]